MTKPKGPPLLISGPSHDGGRSIDIAAGGVAHYVTGGLTYSQLRATNLEFSPYQGTTVVFSPSAGTNSAFSALSGTVSTFASLPESSSGPTIDYDTSINTASDNHAYKFWQVVSGCLSNMPTQRPDVYATTGWSVSEPSSERQSDAAGAAWGALLYYAVSQFTSDATERNDVLKVIVDSLPSRNSENRSGPANLLRACAVGGSIANTVSERPHIYPAAGSRIVLDYVLEEDRFTAVVSDDYVHLMGTLRGTFRDSTIRKNENYLDEVKGWMEAI